MYMSITSSQDAANAVGGNQYLLIRMATQRAREISRGSKPMIDPVKYGHIAPISIALEEIQQKLYTEAHFNGETKTAEQIELEKSQQEKEQYGEYQFTQSERNPE